MILYMPQCSPALRPLILEQRSILAPLLASLGLIQLNLQRYHILNTIQLIPAAPGTQVAVNPLVLVSGSNAMRRRLAR